MRSKDAAQASRSDGDSRVYWLTVPLWPASFPSGEVRPQVEWGSHRPSPPSPSPRPDPHQPHRSPVSWSGPVEKPPSPSPPDNSRGVAFFGVAALPGLAGESGTGGRPSGLKQGSRQVDDLMMELGVGPVSEHHVSGLYVTMLIDNLATYLSEEEIRDVLRRAGEMRPLEELSDASSWCSYDEFKSLLEEADRTLVTLSGGEKIRLTPKVKLESELAGTIQAFGSPASVLAASTGTNPLVPIRRYETAEVGPGEWTSASGSSKALRPFRVLPVRRAAVCDGPPLLRPPRREKSSRRRASVAATAPACFECAGPRSTR